MKKKVVLLLISALIFTIFATACGEKEQTEKEEKAPEYIELPYSDMDLSLYVTLPDYFAFDNIEKVKVEVTEAEYEEGYKEFAAQFNGQTEVTTGIVEKGDKITINFEGTLEDGTKPSGMQGKSYQYTVGIGAMIQGFDEAIIGSKIGETVTAHCVFPEKYHDPDLEGKGATFVIQILSKSEDKEYTGLTEEMLAKTNFKSLEEMEQAIRDAVLEDANNEALLNTKQKIITDILEKAEVTEVPEEKVNKKTEMFDKFNKIYAELQGIDWEEFKAGQFGSDDVYTVSLNEEAKNVVMQNMVIMAIAQKEDIKIEKSEYDTYKNYYIQQTGKDTEEGFSEYFGGISIDEYLEYAGIVDGLVAEKISDMVYERCAK